MGGSHGQIKSPHCEKNIHLGDRSCTLRLPLLLLAIFQETVQAYRYTVGFAAFEFGGLYPATATDDNILLREHVQIASYLARHGKCVACASLVLNSHDDEGALVYDFHP